VPDTLSQRLLLHADEEERDFHDELSEDERDEYWQSRKLVEKLVKIIVTGRQRITPANIGDIESLLRSMPDALTEWLDEFYARTSLEECPRRVHRTLQLSALTAPHEPTFQTNLYVSEATRAYILGLDMASVAMCRAALEQALKERLNTRQFIGLENLVDEAKRLKFLTEAGVTAAKEVSRKGNALLHKKPIQGDEAFEVLAKTRSVLEELYSTET
jgi:hypothetical protein